MIARTSLLLPLLLSALPAQGGGITWQTDLEAAKKVAANERMPLFVVFRCES